MNRRAFLKAAIAAPIVAAVPWYAEKPVEVLLERRAVTWKVIHESVILNRDWVARVERPVIVLPSFAAEVAGDLESLGANVIVQERLP